MSFFSRFTALALLVALLPAVLAHGGGSSGGNYGSSGSSSSQCSNSSDFWYSRKSCCLPSGGPSTKPSPPKGVSCPTTHYWGRDQGCCVPTTPNDEGDHNCSNGDSWDDDEDCCKPPTSSTPPSSTPSHGYGNSHKRAAGLKSRAAPLCPSGLDACPIPGMEAGDYECMDTSSDLEACGGCPSLGKGEDCTAIEGAWNVACENRTCMVYSCAAGFMKSYDGKTCVSLA